MILVILVKIFIIVNLVILVIFRNFIILLNLVILVILRKGGGSMVVWSFFPHALGHFLRHLLGHFFNTFLGNYFWDFENLISSWWQIANSPSALHLHLHLVVL